MTRRAIAALAFLLAATGALAQYDEDDERLREAEERDARDLAEQQRGQKALVDANASPEEMRAAFIELADRLVRDNNFDVAESELFVVRTDDPRLDADLVVALFEQFVDFFESFWVGSGELEPAGERTPVYMLYSYAEYNQLLDADFRFSTTRPKGHYAPWLDAIAAHSDSDSVGDLTDTMLHELTHQLAGSRLGIGHATAPPWIVEGIATYFGFTYRDRKDGFVLGRIGDKNASFYRDIGPRKPQEPLLRLQNVKRSLRASERAQVDSLGNVLKMEDPGSFYGAGTASYNLSWIAFHYLFHGEEGAHRDAFVGFLRGEDRSYTALLEALGVESERLHAAIATHARTMKVR